MSSYRFQKPQKISDVLQDFIDDYPHRKRLKRGMILSLFPRIVGPKIAEQVSKLYFKEETLYAHVPNDAWRHEIHMKRYSIAKRLNDEVGEKIIKELRIKAR
jgi:predicted nucleic acid-binding Zn ribbon protein